jgi:glycosyltransferase involved in cell wall biosynthesis
VAERSDSALSICFFSRLKRRDEINYVAYYLNDLRILRELGYRVHVATRGHELRPADLYFVWWWTWGFEAVMFARLLGRPTIVTGALHAHEFTRRPLIERRLIEYSFARASANLFISESELSSCTEIVDVRNPSCVPLAVDTLRYASDGQQRHDGLLFCVAKMTELNGRRKCIPELIAAFRAIRDVIPGVRLVIAGERLDGYPAFRAVAESFGVEDAIDFPGVVDEGEKIRLMQSCAIYVQPTRFEGFGVAILEAMSCGAPVVTSPVGAVPQVVGEVAELVDGSSPASIAQGVLRLLNNPGRRERLAHAGRSRAVSMFSYEKRKERLSKVIDEVLSTTLRRDTTKSPALRAR